MEWPKKCIKHGVQFVDIEFFFFFFEEKEIKFKLNTSFCFLFVNFLCCRFSSPAGTSGEKVGLVFATTGDSQESSSHVSP